MKLQHPDSSTQATGILSATETFLATLPTTLRDTVQFPFKPQPVATPVTFTGGMNGGISFVGEQYGQAVWSNFPVSDVPRPGLSLGSLSPVQGTAALEILRVLLSPSGYRKVIAIMQADQVLSESGTPYATGTRYYTLGIIGAPSATAPWMLQFGGHHLALNAVLAGPNVSLVPLMTGAQPAHYVWQGQEVRPLSEENDKAFRLMNALGDAQQQKATLGYALSDLVLRPGRDGQTLPPEGLPALEMTEAQRLMLLELISEWVGLLNARDAAPKLDRIKADLDRTSFAWHGPTTHPSPVYFRITGPTLHIEFAHQQAGRRATGVQAGGVNHIHTVYRDPTNAYGTTWTQGS